MMQTLRIFIISTAILACAIIGVAQTSEPSPPTVTSQPAAPAVENAKEQEELAEDIKQLEELKAQNDEILKQQQAALDSLDELQREADQIRIFSKRG